MLFSTGLLSIFNVEDLADWLTNAASTREQMTRTVYDVAVTNPDLCTPPGQLCQRNLRNRVSYSYVQPAASSSGNPPYSSATYYSYDIHGNVDELVQHYNAGIMQSTGNAFKKITYDYDLISGKVNNVSYQPGEHDQFYHRYEYDAENRITKVHTSGDGVIWETDARYYYYRHGPLARTETGDLLVQGTDYAYTLQGWLKGVNSSALDPAHDMGEDGNSTSIVARDVYGFALHYYNTDYAQINTAKTVFAPINTTVHAGFKALFNGNIAAMAVNIGQFNRPLIYNYGYDQLNRLVAMDAYTGLNSSTNAWTPVHTSDYRERISYDGNGNILTYRRFGTTLNGNSLPMDSLDYNYAYDGGGRLLNNQLEYVDDHVNSSYTTDIDDQSTGNYTYDAIGNLITDDQEGISEITWNVYGKISSITKSGPVTITYEYDASGNRIGKTVGNNPEKHTWYVRDASGNVMAVYEDENSSINNGALSQIEVHLYGSARLGVWRANRDVENWPAADVISLTGLSEGGVRVKQVRGEKIFELSNHLGNVLVTISDRRVEHNTSGTTIDYYEANVVSASDYYPFGMGMAERKYFSEGYRYGFNGFEYDSEISSTRAISSFADYGYDARTVKRWSPDLYEKQYPNLSPYSIVNNNPIIYKDKQGLDWEITVKYDKTGNKTIHMKLTGAVLDGTSGQAVNVNALKAAMETQIKDTYGVSYKEATEWQRGVKLAGREIIFPTKAREVNVVVEVDLRVITSESQLKSNEHLFEIVDNNSSKLSKDATAAVNKIGGKVIRIKEKYVPDIIANINKKTVPHEVGHTLALRHIDKPAETPLEKIDRFFGGQGNDQYRGPASANPDNVMLSHYKPAANKINSEQMNIIVEKYKDGKINKK